MKKIAIIGVILVTFFSCDTITIPLLSEIKTGTVTGVVFDKNTGNPKAGVNVSIKGDFGSSRSGYGCNPRGEVSPTSSSFVTGSDGVFIFTNVLPSAIQYKCGDSSASVEIVYTVSIDNTNHKKVNVVSGQTTNVDFVY